MGLEDPEPLTFTWMVIVSSLQFLLAARLQTVSASWLIYTFTVGPFLAGMLHRLSGQFGRNLVFRVRRMDAWSGIVCNWATGWPTAELLRPYLFKRQRDVFVRPAVQSWQQFLYPVWWLSTRSDLSLNSRFLWVNVCAQMCVNTLWIWIFGWTSWSYLALSAFLAACPWHPAACHMMNVTHSERSWRNMWTLNQGYSVEQRKFPQVPWTRLPLTTHLLLRRTL